jgi:hypothetical protein
MTTFAGSSIAGLLTGTDMTPGQRLMLKLDFSIRSYFLPSRFGRFVPMHFTCARNGRSVLRESYPNETKRDS